MRHLTLLTLKHNMYIHAVHIPGKHNDIADAISRFQFQRFQKLAPNADTNPCQINSTNINDSLNKEIQNYILLSDLSDLF